MLLSWWIRNITLVNHRFWCCYLTIHWALSNIKTSGVNSNSVKYLQKNNQNTLSSLIVLSIQMSSFLLCFDKYKTSSYPGWIKSRHVVTLGILKILDLNSLTIFGWGGVFRSKLWSSQIWSFPKWGGYFGVNFGHPISEVFQNGGGGYSGLQFQKGVNWRIWTKIYCSARNLFVHHSSISHTTYVETNQCAEMWRFPSPRQLSTQSQRKTKTEQKQKRKYYKHVQHSFDAKSVCNFFSVHLHSPIFMSVFKRISMAHW